MSTTRTVATCTFRDGKPVAIPTLPAMRQTYADATAVLRAIYRGEPLTAEQNAMIDNDRGQS